MKRLPSAGTPVSCPARIIITVLTFLVISCNDSGQNHFVSGISYPSFKISLLKEIKNDVQDSSNIFDAGIFIPGRDSLDSFLKILDSVWRLEPGPDDHQSRQMNLSMLQSFFSKPEVIENPGCREKACNLFAEIVKSKQILFLYLDGTLVDSFDVSTGVRGRETPNLSVSPSGPLFTKYTSKKFPGGDYQGLGNMPYAVFIRGGYAIHGTTPGNFSKLGRPASHGCIRLHPDNAKIFFELVKEIGLGNTWITIKES